MSVDFRELPDWLIRHALESPESPVTINLEGKPIGVLQFQIGSVESPIDPTNSKRLQEILTQSRESYRQGGGISLKEFKQSLKGTEEESAKVQE